MSDIMTEKNTRISSITRKECRFPAVESEMLSGCEGIKGTGLRLIDYWAWGHSCLIDNTERGIFAEFLVHTAMNESVNARQNWKSYDVLSPEGIRIEVKASGYIQAWQQEKLSSVKFSIRPAHVWDPETNTYDEELSRDSDVYVFCLHKHREQDSINILDLSQWTFFVISTQTLQTAAGMQKAITLNRLKSLGANETDYDHLRDTVIQTVRSNNQ